MGLLLYILNLNQDLIFYSSFDFYSNNASIFSSLISAVDPVAVLAIFDEIGVNKSLYFLVFGESLFNDGVSVVLYNSFVGLATQDNPGADQYGLAILSFFFVAGGGIMIGFIVGCLSAFFCKFTGHTRVVEPLVIFISGKLLSKSTSFILD